MSVRALLVDSLLQKLYCLKKRVFSRKLAILVFCAQVFLLVYLCLKWEILVGNNCSLGSPEKTGIILEVLSRSEITLFKKKDWLSM